MVAKLVDGKAVAEDIRDNLKKQIGEFTNNYAISPKFAVIVVGQNPASKIYFMDGDSPSPLPLMNIGGKN